ncbi:dihydrolipoyl dehydrogenase [Pectobacterium aroidearum]|uniref:dihydrolipoyl dehydrogenase n=1 Tax=Pectobacterium aroidearum TaxID=1201031 RepID=UPI002A8318A0|nr:dihydrolipoyl dehydrogenase [Pectobacterium aroidearum]MDY4385381.1 dihydrolipoyl dehydrogenase [Pectobacterium aroidearum]
MTKVYDVAVIGAGPGGYIAAIRAAQRKLDTICIDAFTNANGDPSLGGTCLNVGCIPSKSLLQSSELFNQISHQAQEHGITAHSVQINAAQMVQRKDDIVARLTQGIGLLFQKNGVTTLAGRATLQHYADGIWCLDVTQGGESQIIHARHVIIATGSRPRVLPDVTVDNELVLDNQGALAMTEPPKRLAVIGAGVIGLELGSVWKRLGSDVTLLEMAETFLPALESRLAKEAQKQLAADGLHMQFGIRIVKIVTRKNEVQVTYEQGDQTHELIVDKLIVAIGREPMLEGLGIERLGLEKDIRGGVVVDECCRTSHPQLWAIGDVVRGPMLAHKAMAEGVMVADLIAGQAAEPVDFNLIPWVIYTHPEIAWIGQSEAQLKQRGITFNKGNALFAANGRAMALGQAEGRVSLLADAASDRLLGATIIGPQASELINEIALAMAFCASGEDLACTVHAHPTLSEVLHEAALAINKQALHG